MKPILSMRTRAAMAAVGVVLLTLSGLAVAGPGEPRLTGLVELPGLFGTIDPDGPPGALLPADPVPVPLFADPDAGSPRIALVSSPGSLEWREFDYEAAAAVAYGEERGWVRVALRDDGGHRYGWVPPEHHGTVHGLADLLEHGLAYLTPGWDGLLRDVPSTASASARIDRADPGAFVDVNVIETLEAGDITWLKVEVLGPGRCEMAGSPTVEATGWVPALAADGRTAAWFHSRGC